MSFIERPMRIDVSLLKNTDDTLRSSFFALTIRTRIRFASNKNNLINVNLNGMFRTMLLTTFSHKFWTRRFAWRWNRNCWLIIETQWIWIWCWSPRKNCCFSSFCCLRCTRTMIDHFNRWTKTFITFWLWHLKNVLKKNYEEDKNESCVMIIWLTVKWSWLNDDDL